MSFLRSIFLFLVLALPGLHAKPLTVGTVAWPGFSPLNVADAKGFWKAQGLDVLVTVFSSNQEVNAALSDGRIDVALDMIGSWIGLQQQGHDLVIIGETDWSFGGDKIIAKREFDPLKLKGERIGVYLNEPSVTFFLSRFLQSNRLTLKDVELVSMDPKSLVDGFVANRLAVIVNYDPQATRAVREGDGRVMATSATYPGVIPEGFAAERSKWNHFDADLKLKFWKGWLKAVTWSQDPSNWPEYQKILNQYTFPDDPDFSEEELRAMVSSIRLHLPAKLAERNCRGGGLERYVDDLRKFLEASGGLKRQYVASELLETDSFTDAIAGVSK